MCIRQVNHLYLLFIKCNKLLRNEKIKIIIIIFNVIHFEKLFLIPGCDISVYTKDIQNVFVIVRTIIIILL